ncbi:MAG: nuclear transport factor 2 family protein [Nannocystales bacterium]
MSTPSSTPERAMQSVMRMDKDAWLDCFSPTAWVRDPVGGSPLDPEAKGFRGRAEIGKLWDALVAPLRAVKFEVREEHASGRSVARVATVSLTLSDDTLIEYPGVFVYDLDEQHRIEALRGYFELPALG